MDARRRSPRFAFPSLIILCSLLVLACGERETYRAGSTTLPDTSQPGAPGDLCAIEPDPGIPDSQRLLLRVYSRATQAKPGHVETAGPEISLYADGTMIVYGAQPAIYPGFALPSLAEVQLTDAGIEELFDRYRETGVFSQGSREIGEPQGAESSRVEAFLNDGSACAFVVIHNPPWNSQPTGEARTAAMALSSQLHGDLIYGSDTSDDTWFVTLPAQYTIQRMRVVAVPEQHAVLMDSSFSSPPQQWPLGAPLSELGEPFAHPSGMARCGVVENGDMPPLRSALSDANILTRWVSGDQRYIIYLRPLMPDEPSASACDTSPDSVAQVCPPGSGSADFPSTMPDPLAEALEADLVVSGIVLSVYLAQWTTADGRRPGACGDDPGLHQIVTPVLIQIDRDPLIAAGSAYPQQEFVYVALPGGTVSADEYRVRDDVPLRQDQRVLLSLDEREPIALPGSLDAIEWDTRLILVVTDDGMAIDPTGTLTPRPVDDLIAEMVAAVPPERIPAPKECDVVVEMTEQAPHPGGETHMADVISTGRVVEVLPAQWTTTDGAEPVGLCWAGQANHFIITPIVIELDEMPLMTHMGEDTPRGRIVAAVFGGEVGGSRYSVDIAASWEAGEHVLVSLWRGDYLTWPVETPAGTTTWEVRMKFTITADQMVIGYPSVYEPMPLATVLAWIDEAILTTPEPTMTPQR